MKNVRALEIAKKIRTKKVPEESAAPMKSSIVSSIMAKKMNKGGMVEEPESLEMDHEFHDEDFLSAEEQDHVLDETYPDPDGVEKTEGMDPKRKLLKKIFAKIHE